MKPLNGAPVLTVSIPPHAHCGRTFKQDAFETIIALLPAAAFAIWHYQMLAVRVLALSCFTAVITETICLYFMKREIEADNYTALLYGLMFGFLIPPAAPWWLVVAGSFISVFMGRMIFGGLGTNPLCVPLVGWAVLAVSWPELMDFDMTMLASELTYPLSQLKNFGPETLDEYSLKSLLLGFQLGGTGAAQAGAVMLGGIYLLARRIVRPDIPLAFIAGVAATAAIFFSLIPLSTLHRNTICSAVLPFSGHSFWQQTAPLRPQAIFPCSPMDSSEEHWLLSSGSMEFTPTAYHLPFCWQT